MADQGKWFKLWCSSLDDAALEDLELADWSRWARFGAYIKSHGNAGEIEIKSPCRSIQNLWRVKSYREIITVLVRLPNLMISTGPIQWPHGKLRPPTCKGEILCGKWCTDGRGLNWQTAVVDTPLEEVVNLWEMKRSLFVSFINWHKYQDDLSTGRVVKLRLSETLQEEKRREEKRRRRDPSSPTPSSGNETDKTVSEYRIPEKDKDPTSYLVMQYKIRKIGQGSYDDRRWDVKHWPRVSAAAKDLLEILGGADDAKRCLAEVAEEFEKKNLSWTLETVAKWAHEWKARKSDGLKHSQRFLDALARQRTSQGLTRMGGHTSDEPSPDGVRNLSPVQVKAGTD